MANSMSPDDARLIADAIEMVTEPLLNRIRVLEKRATDIESQVKDFEERRGLKFVGVWRDDAGGYAQHDVVAHNGSMWVCLKTTRGRPGDSRDWQLSVKCGRDGRDAGPRPARDAARVDWS